MSITANQSPIIGDLSAARIVVETRLSFAVVRRVYAGRTDLVSLKSYAAVDTAARRLRLRPPPRLVKKREPTP